MNHEQATGAARDVLQAILEGLVGNIAVGDEMASMVARAYLEALIDGPQDRAMDMKAAARLLLEDFGEVGAWLVLLDEEN